MTFDEAIAAVKNGEEVSRPNVHWYFYQDPWERIQRSDTNMIHGYVFSEAEKQVTDYFIQEKVNTPFEVGYVAPETTEANFELQHSEEDEIKDSSPDFTIGRRQPVKAHIKPTNKKPSGKKVNKKPVKK